MPIPQEVSELIERFERNRESYRSSEYNETQARREFIDPFFKALGWDIDNEQGYAEAYKDVVHEDAIKIGGATKAPDYAFRVGGARKFFVEAKRPGVDIKNDPDPAYQLRRYAWSAKLPLSILTDFEEFAVYDCRIKPNRADKASMARTKYFTYKEYAERWDEIASIFAHEEILKGSFDRYAESAKKKRGTAEVDDAFLKEIENWRDLFARNIALRNPDLSTRELNYAVQRTVDRIIFLRICEDRGIESYGQLRGLQNGTRAYERLCQIFRRADERYNSGLFHFSAEKKRPDPPDDLTLNLTIDDKVLKEVFKGLYYPESPFEFSVLPADILGHIYEQFLGKVIRLTPGHRAKVEDKPEVKKAGGVYYTPTYIVDYIVKNTVGKLLEGKTPTKVAKIRVLDPACGSGSFLLGAYQYLLDWHQEWYAKHDPEKHAKGRNPKVYRTISPSPHGRGQGEGAWRLTTAEKKRILLNNIYGADIDTQAVEVTKLSLLLKVLEGENAETLGKSLRLFHERALPDLGENIKCGNSLIGPDFYEGQQLSLLDDEERYRINAFDWKSEFPEIFVPSPTGRGQGEGNGFDAVIGNPPYVDIKALPSADVEYIFSVYSTANNRINLFAAFIERSLQLVNPASFRFSMIIPTAFLTQESYGSIRKRILDSYQISQVVRIPNESFGSAAGDVKVDTAIIVLKQQASRVQSVEVIGYGGYQRVSEIDVDTAMVHEMIPQASWIANRDFVWTISTTPQEVAILRKCENDSITLQECVQFSLGLTPYDRYKGHTPPQITAKVFHADYRKDETFKPLLAGNDVRRYCVTWNGKHWISYGPWLGAPRERRFFTEKRILVKQIIDWTSRRIWAALAEAELYNTQNAFNLLPRGEWSLEFLLGILNSRLMTFYHRKKFLDEFKMRFQKILIKDCRLFPIRKVDLTDPGDRSRYDFTVKHVSSILKLHKDLQAAKTDHEKELIRRQIDATDKQVDQFVYELYRLTKKEIRIVEEATAKK